MDRSRLPVSLLIALGLAPEGCTSKEPYVGPCLSQTPIEDPKEPPADDEGEQDPQGDEGGEPKRDVGAGPCLSPADPPVGPCLQVRPPDPEVGPCLNFDVAPNGSAALLHRERDPTGARRRARRCPPPRGPARRRGEAPAGRGGVTAMRAKNWSIGVGLGFVLGLACNKPDSVELGGACKDTVECKDPSDTCMVFGQKQVCTMTCTKDDRCPDAYACVRLDTTVQRNGETSKGGIAGYCIDRVDVPARAATVY